MVVRPLFAPILAILLAAPALAQTDVAGGLGRVGGADGLGGLLGRTGLPNIGGTSLGNAAGLLGYCVKNNVLTGTAAQSVLGKLSNKAGIAATPGFAAGQAGEVQTGKSSVSLAAIKGQVKTKLCGMVLAHAKSFL